MLVIVSLVTWHPMRIIVCLSWLDTRCWSWYVTRDLKPDIGHRQTMTNSVCQVMSDRLWQTSCVNSRVINYYQHWTSSHEWQTITNIGWQVTSDRLWPTSDVLIQYLDFHLFFYFHHLKPSVGHRLSLVTWLPMLVIVYHSWLDTWYLS
jgi:hypothetical protein